MTAEPRRSVRPIVAVLMFLPMMYVLSMGPFVGLADHRYLPDALRDVLQPIYVPAYLCIRSASESSDTVRAFFDWYFDLFEP